MNRGLKNYTKQIQLTAGNAAETSINVNKNDANLHISVPLITTVGLRPIDTSLTFNLQDRRTIGLFGRGFMFNFYNYVLASENKIKVYNYDGSADEYTKDKENDYFYNKETQLKVRKISDDYQIYSFEIEDKQGNVSEIKNFQSYPKTIRYKNGDKITTDFIASTNVIKNDYGDEIRLSKNGSQYITQVAYYHDNALVNSVVITYDSNGYISKLTYKNGSTIVATTSFEFTDDYIVVIDNLSGYRIKYNLSGDNRVISFIDGYDANYTNGHETAIEYYDGYSVLTNYNGEKSYSFFDSNDLPTFELDEDGNIIETEFDLESKKLISNSGSISFNSLENLLGSEDISTFENNGLTITKVNQEDSKFKHILGDEVYKVSGSGTLTKKIAINGLATDNILALLFGKQLSPTTDNSYVEVSLLCGGKDSDKFSKTKVDGLFELLTLGVSANRSFEEITLTIKLVGEAEIELCGIKVANKEFASFYNYDESGNTTRIGSGSNTTSLSYGSNNLPSQSIGVDFTVFRYGYDEYGNLVQAETAYGAKIENTYDETYKSNLLSNKVVDKSGNKILETSKTYTSDGRFVLTSTDELGNTTTYDEYDAFGKIKKVTNALNAVTRFTYNGNGTLQKILLEKDSDSTNVRYTYDSKNRLTKVTLANESYYSFTYDSLNNIKQIKLNGVVVFSYEYDLSTGNLIKQTYGANSDAFIFEYNDSDLISSIYYQPKYGTKTLKFKYFYNDDKQLLKVEDGSGSVLNEYEYDENRKVSTIKTSKSEIKNTYDNLGNVASKKVEVDGQKYYSSYDTVSRSKGSNPSAVYAPFSKTDAYIGMFETSGTLHSEYANEDLKPIINHESEQDNLASQLEGVIPYISVNSSKRLSYKLTNKSRYNAPCGHISFWFKSSTSGSSTTKKYLFSVHTSYVGNHIDLGSDVLFPDFIGIYLLGKKVYLEAIDWKGNHYDLITSDYEVNLSKWNFVSLNFLNRYDGQGYSDVCEYALVVNAYRQTFKKQDPRIYIDCDPEPVMNIGHKYDGTTSSNDFSGKIAALMIGRRTYLTNDTILKYYRLTKDYLIDNELVDSSVKTVDFSQTNLFTTNQSVLSMFNIYPLQNNVTSLDGKRPIKFESRNISSLDKDRTFNFNSSIKRYAYVADGEELVYDFDLSSAGTIAMRAYTDVSEDKQYLFEAQDNENKKLALYRNENNILIVDINGTKVTTGLTFSTNSWHSLAFSFKESVSSSSQSSKYLDLRVVLDDKSWSISKKVSFSYSNLKVIIGRQFKRESVLMTLGSYYTSYPLYGQIEMLATRPAYCELSTLNTLMDELKGLTKLSEFDDFGMLKKVDIHECGKSILSNTYFYMTRTDNTKYTSKQVRSENIRCGSSIHTRKYESDALGNITKITDSKFGSHTYEYDYRGFLTKADDETYTYDKNGNITKKGNITFEYDSTIKDRLISVNGQTIEYDSANPLNPKTYKGYTYNFEGRRLTRVVYGGGYYAYTYNDQGLRIKKMDYRGVTWNYTYDGDKLITETSPYGRLDFLYDENGNLYGFTKDKKEKYLYIRDVLHNILGITDINGNVVVKYNYDAWGTCNIAESTTEGSSIAELNPFRYKGYYYDGEVGLYYCKTRYYVPAWSRWLNADSPKNLIVTNTSLVNLFGYCSNNPISYHDKAGNFSWGDIWNGIKNFFTETVGGFIETTVNIITKSVDYLFFGYEVGENISVVAGDDTKPISFYVFGPSEWWKFWEIKVGVNINIGDCHASLGVGLTGVDASFGYKNSSVDIRVGLDRIGIGTSYEQNGVIVYDQFYINTIPTALAAAAIAVAIVAPETIPAIVTAITSFAYA